MCGICGLADWKARHSPDLAHLERMVHAIRHRGPDESSAFVDGPVGLGHTRLSIVDLSGGGQPMCNEDESLWVVYNGEVYNYPDLTADMERRGHRFRTRCDTEVLLHLYEEYGPGCLRHLNGQFAFALWDSRRKRLFMARDPLGVRPLYYTEQGGRFAFASEVKSLFSLPWVTRALDPAGIDQVFTFWSTLAPRTVFEGIHQLPPGHYMFADASGTVTTKYWSLDYDRNGEKAASEDEWMELLREELIAAVRVRMRADVPVGAYLSGGLDSSLTSAIVRKCSDADLETFAIRFADANFDETPYQEAMARRLGTRHHSIVVSGSDIAAEFPSTVRHAETVMLRTAPVPLLALSRLVSETGIKVVVTGEGADELFAGYNIFKENMIRRLWAKEPDSPMPRQLLAQLYPYVKAGDGAKGAFWQQFFATGLHDTDNPCYSHMIRWNNTCALKRFFAGDFRARLHGKSAVDEYAAGLPEAFANWDSLSQAQYIEITTFLSGYLLSSQGDRMSMGHGVEGRFPFLDPSIVKLSAAMQPHLRLHGMEEKYLLRRVAREFVPGEISDRPKQPYRAPISAAFFAPDAMARTRDWASRESIEESAVFDAGAVEMLFKKLAGKNGGAVSEREDMAAAGILSTMLLYDMFVKRPIAEEMPAGVVRVVRRSNSVAFSGDNK